MTVSKPFLLGVLALGMLVGAGGSLLLFEGLRDGRAADAGPGPKTEAGGKKKKKKPAQDPLPEFTPQQAASELGRWVNRATSPDEHDYLRRLVSKAAEWSPDSTLEQTMLIADPYLRRDVMKRLFNYWIGSDREAALAAIKAIDNVALQRDLYREAMSWLSGDDPRAAISMLEKTNNPHDHELWSRSFARWARTDREEATRSILRIEHPAMREQVLVSVARSLADHDFAKALEWVGTLKDGYAQIALTGVLSEAAEDRPELVIAHLAKIPEGRTRREIIGRAADEWAERDPQAALEWAESLSEDERILAIGEIAETVFETDPDRAQEIVDRIPDSEKRRGVIEHIARLRTTVNVEEALAWVDSLPEEDRSKAWSGVAREWARIDPEAAAAHAATVEDPHAREQLIAAASYSWAQRDPAGAAQWAATLEGKPQANAMYRIVDTWAREKPEAAGEFVANSLEGELQANMTRQVVSRWLRDNTADASAWVDTLPDGGARDSAVYTLIGSIESEFPATALQWANTIGDEKKRDYVVRRIAKRMERE